MRPALPLSRVLLLLLALGGGAACGDDGSGPPEPGLPASVEVVSGGGQVATAGAALPQPVVVRVLDEDGRAVPGQSVEFVLARGSVSASPVVTDAQGRAQTGWTLGNTAGTQTLEVRVPGGEDGATLTAAVEATARADAPAEVEAVGTTTLSGSAGAALDSLAVRVVDRFGNPVPGAAVVWTVRGGGGSISPPTSTTGADGVAKARWTLGTRLDSAQVAEAAAGVGISVSFVAAATAPATATLVKVSGDSQQGEAGNGLAAPLVVSVRLADGRPLQGAAVTWSLPEGSSGTLTPAVTPTDANGEARTQWTLGARAGMLVAQASVPGLAPVSFTATAGLPETATLVKVSGDAQTDTVGQTLPNALVVRLQLPDGRPVAGGSVTWTAGAGSLAPPATMTDVSGLAVAQWTLGTTAGGMSAAASLPEGQRVLFTATAVPDVMARVELSPDSLRFPALGQQAVVARRRVDRFGNTVDGIVPLVSTNIAVADVAEDGTVRSRANGTTLVIGRVGALADTTTVRVQQVVASITLPAVPDSVFAGDTLELAATAADANGNPVSGTSVAYASSDPAVAAVSPAGRVTALAPGEATITATADGRSASRVVRVRARPVFVATLTAPNRACGLTDAGEVFCWGAGNAVPRAAAPGFRFRSIALGVEHTCGLSAAGEAFCWGNNGLGQLGIGNGPRDRPPPSAAPARVLGGHTFAAITAGGYRTCALDADGDAFCWGDNGGGSAGDSSSFFPQDEGCGAGGVPCRTTPRRVVGGLKFASIDAAQSHTCAVTAAGAAWCWGDNTAGELGTGAAGGTFSYPMAVAGGHAFRRVAVSYLAFPAASFGSCGVTTGGAALCWGQVGGVPSVSQPAPAPLPGGFAFDSLSVYCGVTTADDALCWGTNHQGQVGDGTTTARPSPVPVAGGRKWRSVSSGGGDFACGVTTDGRLFCWGGNAQGQLGSGTTTPSSVPVAVASPR